MTWPQLAADDPFGIHNLPYGAFDTPPAGTARGRGAVGVRVGGHVLNLSAAEERRLVDARGTLVSARTLNPFLAQGRALWTGVRRQVTDLLTDSRHRAAVAELVLPLDEVRSRLPFDVGDYVDFYSSEHHAGNVGQIFRPSQPQLPPVWKHLPIGYHGRAGTVVVSGTPVVRPCGQRPPADGSGPAYGPSQRLDVEAEVGFVVGQGTRLGARVSTDDFTEHVFGVVLVNDWSARDIQAWEYQPLGPFLGKSFATSISAWVVPLEALEQARVPAPDQDPPVLDYLREADRYTYDLALEIRWNDTVVSRPPFRELYWTPAQQLAHLTVNGASLRVGDLYASGTVSGPARDQTGSFLELTWGGAEPVTLVDGSSRRFLEDGDTVTITATAPGPDGTTVGFGHVSGTIKPAIDK
jgi:fumarylacetoacetase